MKLLLLSLLFVGFSGCGQQYNTNLPAFCWARIQCETPGNSEVEYLFLQSQQKGEEMVMCVQGYTTASFTVIKLPKKCTVLEGRDVDAAVDCLPDYNEYLKPAEATCEFHK